MLPLAFAAALFWVGVPSARHCVFSSLTISIPNDNEGKNNDDYGTVNHNLKQVPLTMAYCEDHHTLVTASADMTLLQWYLDDIPSIKHYTIKSRWPTKHAAMSMCWSSSHRLLYSGTTAGTIQGTRCEEDVGLVFQRRFVLLFKRQFSSTSTLTPWRRASEILEVFPSRGRHLILFRKK